MNELQYWSPTLGCDAVRLSVAGDDGQEFFIITEMLTGRAYREMRQRAFVLLCEAIDSGQAPGQFELGAVH